MMRLKRERDFWWRELVGEQDTAVKGILGVRTRHQWAVGRSSSITYNIHSSLKAFSNGGEQCDFNFEHSISVRSKLKKVEHKASPNRSL